MLSAKQISEILESLGENDITRNVLVPLLEKMGMKSVRFVGGANEQGVDAIFLYEVPPDSNIKCAGIQVKKGDIHAQTRRNRSIVEIVNQATLALSSEFSVGRERTRLSRFIVLSTGKVTEQAERFITEKVERVSLAASIALDFWDIETITALVNKRWRRGFAELFGISSEEAEEYETARTDDRDENPYTEGLAICRQQVAHEINSRVRNKYIRNLYVDRALQSEVLSFLDGYHLSRDGIRGVVLQAVEGLRAGAKSIEIPARLYEELDGLTEPAEEDISSGAADDAAQRFQGVASSIRSQMKRAEDLNKRKRREESGKARSEGQIEKEELREKAFRAELQEIGAVAVKLERQARALRPAYVVVERAGGGKTNLACRVAELRAERSPTIFLYGKFDSARWPSFEDYIDHQLARLSKGNKPVRLRDLERRASEEGTWVAVVVDAINESLSPDRLLEALSEFVLMCRHGRRVKLFITCRDLYWPLFSGDWVREGVFDVSRGEIYSFSSDEWGRAIELYLDHFNILVHLTAGAVETLSHPLLLRFFCEAYAGAAGAVSYLGRVDDVRRRDLFRVYCDRKFREVATKMKMVDSAAVASAIAAVTKTMRELGSREVPFLAVADAFGPDSASRRLDSLYSRVLDEDIILEEGLDEVGDASAGESTAGLRVSFVYDEFMEYIIAVALIASCKTGDKLVDSACEDEITKLIEDIRRFPSSLGVLEYVVTLLIEDYGRCHLARLWGSAPQLKDVALRVLTKIPPEAVSEAVVDFAYTVALGSVKAHRTEAVRFIIRAANHDSGARQVFERLLSRDTATIAVREEVLRELSSGDEGFDWKSELLLRCLAGIGSGREVSPFAVAGLSIAPSGDAGVNFLERILNVLGELETKSRSDVDAMRVIGEAERRIKDFMEWE